MLINKRGEPVVLDAAGELQMVEDLENCRLFVARVVEVKTKPASSASAACSFPVEEIPQRVWRAKIIDGTPAEHVRALT